MGTGDMDIGTGDREQGHGTGNMGHGTGNWGTRGARCRSYGRFIKSVLVYDRVLFTLDTVARIFLS